MKIALSLIISVAFISTANAQTPLEDLRREVKGQGRVTINQSSDIENIIVEKNTPAPTEKNNNTSAKPSAQHPTPSNTPATSRTEQSAASANTTHAGMESETINEMKKPRRTYKTTGYRIQVFSGGNKRADKEKCEDIARRLKAAIPGLPVYVHFYSPSWKCRAGNFTSQEEASQVLSQIKGMGYSQACLVKGTISVAY